MKFETAHQMLDYINSNHDLYSPKAEIYVFNYNEAGSIATYSITIDEAKELSNEVKKGGDEQYWAEFLGIGGSIWDDPSYECYHEGQITNLDCCEELLEYEDWVLTNEFGKAELSERKITMDIKVTRKITDDMTWQENWDESFDIVIEFKECGA